MHHSFSIFIKVHHVAEAVCPTIVYDYLCQIFLSHATHFEVVIICDQISDMVGLMLPVLSFSNQPFNVALQLGEIQLSCIVLNIASPVSDYSIRLDHKLTGYFVGYRELLPYFFILASFTYDSLPIEQPFDRYPETVSAARSL